METTCIQRISFLSHLSGPYRQVPLYIHTYLCIDTYAVYMYGEFLLICHRFIHQIFQSATISQYHYNVQVRTNEYPVNPPYFSKTNCNRLMSIHSNVFNTILYCTVLVELCILILWSMYGRTWCMYALLLVLFPHSLQYILLPVQRQTAFL